LSALHPMLLARRSLCSLIVGALALPVTGCATARAATRGTGAALSSIGALSMLAALSRDCDPDQGDECHGDYYDEDTLGTRGVLFAGGGAAVLVGSGLVAAASVPPKRRRKRAPVPPSATVSAPVNARPPETATDRQMRELIEGRCVPESESKALDLRVPDEPRSPLPTCVQ